MVDPNFVHVNIRNQKCCFPWKGRLKFLPIYLKPPAAFLEMSEGSFPKSVAGNGVFWKGSLASVLSWNLEVLEFFGSWKTRKPGGGVRGMRGGHNFSKLWDSNYWVNHVSPITVWLSTFFQPCSLGLVELLFIFYFLQFCIMLFFSDLNVFSFFSIFHVENKGNIKALIIDYLAFFSKAAWQYWVLFDCSFVLITKWHFFRDTTIFWWLVCQA